MDDFKAQETAADSAIRTIVEAGFSEASEILAMVERVLLGVTLFNEGQFGIDRRTSARMIEMVTERVLTNLAALPPQQLQPPAGPQTP